MEWSVEFLNDAVEAEFDALPEDMRTRMAHIAELIEVYGLPRVKMPYVRHLQGKLWEMRGSGRDGIARSIYVAVVNRRIVILRCFIKKTPQTPKAEIALALQRLKEVE